MSATYLSLPEFKDVLGITDTVNDAHMQRALEAATSWIDNHTGRAFVLSAADETRYFYPNPDGTIDLVDLVTATSIALDSNGDRTYATTLAAAEYELLPANGPRYDRVRIWPTSSHSFTDRRVRVVGTFGYVENGATPPAVKQACQIMALRLYSRKDAPFGILGSTDIGQFERLSANDPDVIALLVPYVAGNAASTWVMV